jgi:hypothetical protein
MKSPRHVYGVLSALAATAILLGCASAGAPQPPSLFLPRPPADLQAVRKGNSVRLTWTIPAQTTDREPVRHIGSTEICRSLDPQMVTCGAPVGESAAAPEVPPSAGRPNGAASKAVRPVASFSDPLPADLQRANPLEEATYAVEVLNDLARGAGLSNLVRVPLAPALVPPSNFAAQVTADGVVLTWNNVTEQPSAPEFSHRYRIYRRESDAREPNGQGASLIAELPLADNSTTYLDHTADWEKNYDYTLDIATVVAIPGKPPAIIDGDDAPAVSVITHDIFPPSVPSGLQAVYSGPGQQPFIDLIWAPVTNADLAGYNIYRSDSGAPAMKMNHDLSRTPAYRDSAVSRGRQYTYAVSAVDVRGNESSRSDPASEKVP